jgi:hypothetical protein
VLVDLSLLGLRKSSLHRTGTTGSMQASSVMMMTHLFADAHLAYESSLDVRVLLPLLLLLLLMLLLHPLAFGLLMLLQLRHLLGSRRAPFVGTSFPRVLCLLPYCLF